MKEKWKQIVLFDTDTNYDISNLGHIRKHDTQIMLTPSRDKNVENSYEFYALTVNDKKYNTGIHRLVAMMFIPVPDKYIKQGLDQYALEVDHIDGIRYHNSIDNLRWLTHQENHDEMRKRVGKIKCMDSDTALLVCELLERDVSVHIIAKAFDISEESVNNIRKGKTYKKISKKFHFKRNQVDANSVHKICELLQDGKTIKETAKELNVPESTVLHIRAGNSWKEISKDYIFKKKNPSRETIKTACALLQDDVPLLEIVKITGISKPALLRLRSGETYSDISKDYDLKYKKYRIRDEVIHSICRDLEEGIKKTSAIAADNHVSTSFVKALRNRKHRNDITSQYKY